ncbi:MAG: leucine--tRNA ligase [Microgenomates group bacterium]
MSLYDTTALENKWLQYWEKRELFQGTEKNASGVFQEDKKFLLFAFAYPSGEGLHVGHVESKTALDILARYYRMNGKSVFFPVGWDAFGLPAENYAIKTGIPPAETTKRAINTFRRQIKRLAISYDWKNEIATSHPGYYRWTQWLFLQLYFKGLAYQSTGSVNWCPSCQTVLANEQVVNGKCERCDSEVQQKKMKQWYFKIKDYQDELISGLDKVDWPEATKQQQLHWIGKKEGIQIRYPVVGTDQVITCFTTRPDTNFGATFVVLAPEHEFVSQIASGALKPEENAEKIQKNVLEYIKKTEKKSELDRQQEGRAKSGVFSGFYVTNQLNNAKIPVWISDFVLAGFGTGAVVGVPGHDLRDFEFAKTMELPVIRVIVGENNDTSDITTKDQVQEESGTLINSGFLDGKKVSEAITAMMDHLEKNGWGTRVTNYRLRDWLISRQRYWGAPIPIVYDPEGKPHPVKKEHLPWKLPEDVDFKPTGESPLRSSEEFIARTEKLYGKGWRPEFDTMDTFVDSSWYFMRYTDARNEEVFARPEMMSSWLPVDLYMIGPEHIVLHLLYSRFFTKFLRDEGYVDFDEPFSKMRHQGMILGPDNKKMSKSKGNVINPDSVIDKFGADTLRVYEMFMGPLESDKPWDVSAVAGVYKFLNRIHRLVTGLTTSDKKQIPSSEALRALHQAIEKTTDDIPKLKFNTSIAKLMECVNVWESESREGHGLDAESSILFVRTLAPFAPFLSEELFQMLSGNTQENPKISVHEVEWPHFDENLVKVDELNIPVQINGKLRAQLSINSVRSEDTEFVLEEALRHERIIHWIGDKKIIKQIYIPGKIVNLVVID